MRYAVLGDIHSNWEALEAVLAEAARAEVQRYLCVGDIVGYGADPTACLKQVRGLPLTVVAGNHDWACVGKVDADWFNRYARSAVEWTRERLSFTDLAFLRSLRAKHEEKPLTLVHGTLRCPEKFDYLFDVAQALETALISKTPLCFVGHTHYPFVAEVDPRVPAVRRLLNAPEEVQHVTLDLEGAKYVINPGSVGQPRDGDPRASFAVLDTEGRWVDILRVPYDIATAQRKIREAGLPPMLADRLAVGQ